MTPSIDQQRLESPTTDADVLRNGIHILTAMLLVAAIFASMRMELSAAVVNLMLLSAFAAIYFAGSMFMERWGLVPQLVWLVALTGVWFLDLLVAPVGIYLVFALFFLYLRVLGETWGVVAVIFLTAISIGVQVPDGLTLGGIMGPMVSAIVTVAIYYAFRALQRISREREVLIQELVSTREQLAESERSAGVTEERQRIAHEIHDTLAQGLSSIQMLLHAADRSVDAGEREKARERIALARTTAADNLQEARAMIAALQPASLQETSLTGALTRMAEGFAATGDLTIDVDAEGPVRQLPMKVEAALLRIAQGAVGNVVKHSQATRARITVTYAEDEIRVDVVDNGRGFDVAAVTGRPAGLGHIGLSAMERRAAELGGGVTVESAPGGPTAVSASIPLEPSA